MTYTWYDILYITTGVLFLGPGLIMLFTLPLIMILFPKKLKDRAICPPYFTEEDALIMDYFPQSVMRAMWVSASASWPYYGRRFRNLGPAVRKHSPKWFLYLLYFFFWFAFVPWLIGFVLMVCFKITGAF